MALQSLKARSMTGAKVIALAVFFVVLYSLLVSLVWGPGSLWAEGTSGHTPVD